MAPPDDDDHDCGWKAYAKAQDAKLTTLLARVEDLERRARGHKTEKRKVSKLPPPTPAPKPDADETLAKRRAAAAKHRVRLKNG